MNMRTLVCAAAIMTVVAGAAMAAPKNKGQQADTNHPNIHGKVGQKSAGGTNANASPNGSNANGGQIHGIANVPGKSGANPADGAPGFADQLGTVHGGIGDVNKNAR